MNRIGRYKLTEISLNRLYLALKIRLEEIPHDLAWGYSSSAKESRERIRSFKNKHAGERCFIIANGPSLKRTNLRLLENEITFGLNRIYLLFPLTSFRPTYYVAVNELVLEQFAKEIQELTISKFLNWNRRSYFKSMGNEVTFLKSRMVINDSFQYDLTRPLVFGGTVTFVTLQLAYFMGFKQVILVGLDHNYVEKGVPSETEFRTDERDLSHFHPQYFPKGAKWQLPDLLRSEIDYRLAREAFEQDGRQILDGTIDGKCNIFEKVEYSSLFEKSKLFPNGE